MKIELILDEESQGFFSQLKSGNNALVVPIDKWSTFIQERLGTTRVKDPNFKIAGSYVITDQKAFELFVGELHSIYYGRPDRLVTKEYGAFRFAGKLDQKRVMPPALRASCKTPNPSLIFSPQEAKWRVRAHHFWHDEVL